MAEINSGDVAEGVDDTVLLRVDHQRTLSGSVASVSRLSGTGSNVSGLLDSVQILSQTELLENNDGRLGFLDGLEIVRDNKRKLRDLRDAVTSGHDQGGQSRGGDGRSHSVTLLGLVGGSVPASPGFVGSEHVTTTAHVTESTLSRAVSTTTGNTGDTSHSSTSTPRLGGSLVTSELGHTVGLSSVLRNIREDGSNEVRSQRSGEHGGQLDSLTGSLRGILGVVDGNNRSCERHRYLPYDKDESRTVRSKEEQLKNFCPHD